MATIQVLSVALRHPLLLHLELFPLEAVTEEGGITQLQITVRLEVQEDRAVGVVAVKLLAVRLALPVRLDKVLLAALVQ